MGLAGARRSLNGKDLAVERESDPGSGIDRILAVTAKRSDAGRPPEEQVDGRPIGIPGFETLGENRFAEVLQGVPENLCANVTVQHDALGVLVGRIHSFLDVDGVTAVVDGRDLAHFVAVQAVDGVSLAYVEVLRREAVLLNGRTLGFHGPVVGEARHGAAFVQQGVLLQGAQPEVLPPARLVLPAVELHHVCQREPRPLFVGPFQRVGGHAREQSVAEFPQLLVEGCHRLARLAGYRKGSRHVVPFGNDVGTKPLQPVAQP